MYRTVSPHKSHLSPHKSRISLAIALTLKRLNGTVVKSIDLHGQKVNIWLACCLRCTLAGGAYRFFVYATDAAGNRQSRVGANRLTVRWVGGGRGAEA